MVKEPSVILLPNRFNYGVWCTCFIAFNMKDERSKTFLREWNAQIRRYTAQDQISFSFVVQKLEIHPYSLPQGEVRGYFDYNSWFVKLSHRK